MIYSCIYIDLYSATESCRLFFFSQVRSLLSPYPSHHLKSCSSTSSNLTSGTASQAQSHLPWLPSPRSLSYSQHTLTASAPTFRAPVQKNAHYLHSILPQAPREPHHKISRSTIQRGLRRLTAKTPIQPTTPQKSQRLLKLSYSPAHVTASFY